MTRMSALFAVLVLAPALTVAVELLVLAAAGFRRGRFIALGAAANVLTNLSLNLLLAAVYAAGGRVSLFVYPLEALATAAEYLIFRGYLGPSRRLLLATLAANALSYMAGLVFFGHV